MAYNIALIIDNEVVSTVNCDAQHAAIMLSEPVVIDITDMPGIHVGWKYIDGEFVAPTQN
jgi:hypothetical protein